MITMIANKKEVDIASTTNNSTSEEIKPEKPTVKPRSNPRASPSKQTRSLDNEAEVGEQQSPPVLRRPKSGPGRSRVATSKYRSGLVIENQMSMEEMEKEIEKEMMNNAATKIQAGFRGFQTRKRFSTQDMKGVSRKGRKADRESGKDDGAAKESADCATAAEIASECAAATANVEGATVGSTGSNEQGDLDAAAAAIASREGRKPSLGALRSFSFPGSTSHDDPMMMALQNEEHVMIPTAISEQSILAFVDEGEEDRMTNPLPDVDLELDPDYVNRAATRIQANFRGYQVRKSFKRPSSGKENNGSKSSPKNQKLTAAARQEIEDRARALEQRLQENNNNENPPAQPDKAAAKIQASFRGYKERHKFHQQKKAAITIQANIRGYLTRKRFANLRRRSFQRRRSSAKAFHKELDEIRKVNEAATKIQAVFRGYQVRSKMPRSSSMINEDEQMIDE